MIRLARLLVFVSLFIAGCAGIRPTGRSVYVPEPAPADAPGLNRALLAAVRIDTDGGHGSGIFVSREGHILTARHVVHDQTVIDILALDEKGVVTYLIGATVVAEDKAHDLALLKADFRPAQAAVLAAEGEAHTGDAIYAVGYPHGFGELVTRGYLMSTHYVMNNAGYSLLAVDANGGPGDSGAGICLAGNGKLIGIWQNTAYSGEKNKPLMVIHLGVGIEHIRLFLEANHVPFAAS